MTAARGTSMHSHAVRALCVNCGSAYVASTAVAGQSGSHTHTAYTATPVLSPEVVKEFAKPDPDADLNEWRKKYIG